MEAPLHDLDAAGQTALHYSVCNVDHAIELTSILISAGCDVNARRKIDGWAPIHLATMFGKVEVAKALLRAGADPTIRAELRDLDTVNAEQMAKKLG
jgi:ankyrin repeat protein